MLVVKVLLEPGSLPLLLLALALGFVVARWNTRARRWARIWMTAWCAVHLFLSLPVVARQLVRNLSSYPSLMSADAVPPGTPVVVLAGGAAFYEFGSERSPVMNLATTLRVREAARVQQLLDAPLVIVAGTTPADRGESAAIPRAMRDGLIATGVPAEHVLLEAQSTTTYESAREVRVLLEARKLRTVVLVTSATHMKRSVSTFQGAGLDVVAAPAPIISFAPRTSWRMWIPSWPTLSTSVSCLHEYVGLAYYAVLGRF